MHFYSFLGREFPRHLTVFTHKEHVCDLEVDSKQLPHRAVMLRDGKFKHLPECAEERVCIFLNRVEVVVETWNAMSLELFMGEAQYTDQLPQTISL